MSDAAERVKEIIDQDREDLVQLCLELGNIPSPHAKERVLGEATVGWLKRNGIEAWLQWITDESVNAVGLIRGAGGGSSLILNAHMDTGPELSADASEADVRMEGAWVDGDLVYGKGLINDKAQLCAFMIAARALNKAGVVLGGDLYVTGVATETGEPSVDDTQGVNFPGEGFGAWWLVNRGVTADYALVGETSGFGIIMGECGAVWLKIRCKGRELYTPRLERGESLAGPPQPLHQDGPRGHRAGAMGHRLRAKGALRVPRRHYDPQGPGGRDPGRSRLLRHLL